jgi:hypothetical protein
MTSIVQSIKEAALRSEELYLKMCTVDSVDEKSRTITCTPDDDSAQLEEVSIQASFDREKGLFIVPKKGSRVLVGYLDKNNACVVKYDEIEKIELDVESEIVINGGENKGLVIIEELQKRLKALEAAFNDHVHIATTTATVGTGTVAGTVTIDSIAKKSTEFQTQTSHPYDYENDKVKH